MFFWNSLAFLMIQQMLANWSLVPLPFLNPAWTSGSSWFMFCWSRAWRILSVTWLVCEMSTIVWQFEHALALPFLGMGMKAGLPIDASDRGRPWWRLSPTSVRAVSHCAQSLSRARLLVTPWTAAHQTPLSKEVSRQEHWSGLPFPSPMHESEKWEWSRSVVSDS